MHTVCFASVQQQNKLTTQLRSFDDEKLISKVLRDWELGRQLLFQLHNENDKD